MESGKTYVVLKTASGCKGVEGAKVRRVDTTGLVDSEHCIVKVVADAEYSAHYRKGELWRVNSDFDSVKVHKGNKVYVSDIDIQIQAKVYETSMQVMIKNSKGSHEYIADYIIKPMEVSGVTLVFNFDKISQDSIKITANDSGISEEALKEIALIELEKEIQRSTELHCIPYECISGNGNDYTNLGLRITVF